MQKIAPTLTHFLLTEKGFTPYREYIAPEECPPNEEYLELVPPLSCSSEDMITAVTEYFTNKGCTAKPIGGQVVILKEGVELCALLINGDNITMDTPLEKNSGLLSVTIAHNEPISKHRHYVNKIHQWLVEFFCWHDYRASAKKITPGTTIDRICYKCDKTES